MANLIETVLSSNSSNSSYKNVTYTSNGNLSTIVPINEVSDFWDIGFLYVIPTICVIGVIFNILNFIVLHKLESSFYIFLRAVAIADLLALVFISPIGVIYCFDCLKTDLKTRIAKLEIEIYVLNPLAGAAVTASIWITVALTIQRVLLVSLSKIRKQQWKSSFIKKLIAVIFLVSVVFTIPKYFEVRIVDGYRKYNYDNAFMTFYYWTRFSFIRIIPLILLSISNVILMISLKRYHQLQLQRFSESNPRCLSDSRQTITLSAIIVTFIIGNIPISIVETNLLSQYNSGPYQVHYFNFVVISNILELLSFTLNFVFYCVLNTQFVQAFKEMVGLSHQDRRRYVNTATNGHQNANTSRATQF